MERSFPDEGSTQKELNLKQPSPEVHKELENVRKELNWGRIYFTNSTFMKKYFNSNLSKREWRKVFRKYMFFKRGRES